jgi:broad specificity phosphatase PhoE
MLNVYLLRHAHVDYGPGGSAAGDSPLTPLGHKMAARLAVRCVDWGLQYLFVSTMRRTRETADAISAQIPGLPRCELPEFEEVRLQDLAGYGGEMPGENPLLWQPEHFRYANQQQFVRVAAGWQRVRRLVDEKGLERIAIVGHGGTHNCLLRMWQELDAPVFERVWFELDWAATACVRFADDGCWVCWFNDARHIDDLRGQW